MKKALYILPAFIAASAFATTDYELVGGSGDYKTRVALPSGDYNVILKAPDGETTSEGTMFKGAGSTTITSLDGYTNPATIRWSFTSDVIVDIRTSAAGNVKAVDMSGNDVKWNVGNLTIKNSQSDTNTVATVDVGTGWLFSVNTPASQSDKLKIQTNAAMSGSVLTFNASNGSGIYLSADKTLGYSVGTTTIKSGSVIDLAAGSTFNQTAGTLVFENGGVLNIASGATMNAASTLNFTATASTAARQNIYGTLNYTSAAQIQFGLLDLQGRLNAQNAGTDTNAGIILGGDATVSNGGYFDVKGCIRVINGKALTIAADAAQSTLTHYSKIYMGRVYLITGNLVLNREDAFVTNDANRIKLLVQSNNNNVTINADNFFDNLYFVTDSTNLNVTIGDGAVMGIGYFGKAAGLTVEKGINLVFNDFDDGKFFSQSRAVFDGLT
ncbi:MAG: hypothetical protein IJI37_05965, partial [Opitutales bacterium]|nr:hypothetical protein [Opitutales bacterium]